ncbi:MAG: SufBD protein [Oscillospiraceae bacterium]|nr:SufBD protein [Oscillospiraceae bacterium]
MVPIEDFVAKLTAKSPTEGYAAMKELLAISETSDTVYPYMARLIGMLGSDNSYVRTRGLLLIVANARWDTDYLVDENINLILSHITDPKPITARQFIQSLPTLATAKPDLRADILSVLSGADTLRYPLSMRPLVDGDIRKAILTINLGERA